MQGGQCGAEYPQSGHRVAQSERRVGTARQRGAIYTCMYIVMHMHTNILRYTHTHANACKHAYNENTCMHTHMHACMRAWIHACIDSCTHGFMHARMHAYMHDVCMHATNL